MSDKKAFQEFLEGELDIKLKNDSIIQKPGFMKAMDFAHSCRASEKLALEDGTIVEHLTGVIDSEGNDTGVWAMYTPCHTYVYFDRRPERGNYEELIIDAINRGEIMPWDEGKDEE